MLVMMIVVYQMVVLASGSGGYDVCYPSSAVLLMMYLAVKLPEEPIPARAVGCLR
jgi:hypothetical protein